MDAFLVLMNWHYNRPFPNNNTQLKQLKGNTHFTFCIRYGVCLKSSSWNWSFSQPLSLSLMVTIESSGPNITHSIALTPLYNGPSPTTILKATRQQSQTQHFTALAFLSSWFLWSSNGKFWVKKSCFCNFYSDKHDGAKLGNSLHCWRLHWLDNGQRL